MLRQVSVPGGLVYESNYVAPGGGISMTPVSRIDYAMHEEGRMRRAGDETCAERCRSMIFEYYFNVSFGFYFS